MVWTVEVWDGVRWVLDAAYRWFQHAIWWQQDVEYAQGRPARVALRKSA